MLATHGTQQSRPVFPLDSNQSDSPGTTAPPMVFRVNTSLGFYLPQDARSIPLTGCHLKGGSSRQLKRGKEAAEVHSSLEVGCLGNEADYFIFPTGKDATGDMRSSSFLLQRINAAIVLVLNCRPNACSVASQHGDADILNDLASPVITRRRRFRSF
ncbi:hypothetical protein ACOME3_001514 [Neoechinorhynchus agilis]